MTFPPLIIWAKALFFFEQLFPVVARTWLGEKSVCLFLGPKFRFLAKKSNFYHTTPILVKGPFVPFGETVHIQPWDQFFDFSFPTYGGFHKKKVGRRRTRQKVLPLATVRAPSANNSPSALSAGGMNQILYLVPIKNIWQKKQTRSMSSSNLDMNN